MQCSETQDGYSLPPREGLERHMLPAPATCHKIHTWREGCLPLPFCRQAAKVRLAQGTRKAREGQVEMAMHVNKDYVHCHLPSILLSHPQGIRHTHNIKNQSFPGRRAYVKSVQHPNQRPQGKIFTTTPNVPACPWRVFPCVKNPT